jgi:hypothetical protein
VAHVAGRRSKDAGLLPVRVRKSALGQAEVWGVGGSVQHLGKRCVADEELWAAEAVGRLEVITAARFALGKSCRRSIRMRGREGIGSASRIEAKRTSSPYRAAATPTPRKVRSLIPLSHLWLHRRDQPGARA